MPAKIIFGIIKMFSKMKKIPLSFLKLPVLWNISFKILLFSLLILNFKGDISKNKIFNYIKAVYQFLFLYATYKTEIDMFCPIFFNSSLLRFCVNPLDKLSKG